MSLGPPGRFRLLHSLAIHQEFNMPCGSCAASWRIVTNTFSYHLLSRVCHPLQYNMQRERCLKQSSSSVMVLHVQSLLSLTPRSIDLRDSFARYSCSLL